MSRIKLNESDLSNLIKQIISEAIQLKESNFTAFWQGKKYEIEGKDLWDAKQKAIVQLKIPKSKVGLLSVVSSESQEKGDFRFESVLKEEVELNLIDDNFVGSIGITFVEGSQNFDYDVRLKSTIRQAQKYAMEKLYDQSRYRKTDETLWATFSKEVGNGKWVEDFSKRVKLNGGLKEESNNTNMFKNYSIEEVIEFARLAGLTVLDAEDALMELTVAYGEEIPRSRVEEVLAEYDMSVEELIGSQEDDGDYFQRILFFGPDILEYVSPVEQLLNDNGISFEIYEDEDYDDGSLILEFPSIEEKEKASRLIGQEYRESNDDSGIEEL